MTPKKRFLVAITLSIVLVLTAAGVWAAPEFQGTVPPPPDKLTGTGSAPLDMGTAIITPQCTDCIVIVEIVADPAGTYAPSPEGKAFVGSTFKVTADQEDALVEVCYAYPPEYAEKEAKIYRVNEDATPPSWVEVPGASIGDGTICVNSVGGVFSLIGNP